MLEQILDYIHNYFIREVYRGTFVIENGSLSEVDFLLDGQYFKIRGSVLNDGVYQYPVHDLADEEFTGEIWAMSVPPAVVSLCSEIEGWMEKYGDVVNSPYASESFGGYSRTIARGSSNSNNGTVLTWQSAFAARLNAWRKIS